MSSLANAAQRLGLIGDEALRIVRTTVDGVAFPPYWMEERNHVFAIHTGLEARGWECDEQVSGADLSSEIVFDGVRVPVCIEVFKGHTMQGATRFGLGLRARRHFPIVFAVVLLADTVRSVQKRQTLEGHINLSLDLEISQRNRAFYGASMFVYI